MRIIPLAVSVLAWFAFAVPAQSSERVTPLPSGTLLFLQNSNRLVEGYTGSRFAHVAIVIRKANRSWVYEAAPAKVRRMPIGDYYREISRLNLRRKRQIRVWAFAPKRQFESTTVSRMTAFLDEQLGRRYSVKGIVRKKKGDGIHCSQLASQTLRQTHKLDLEDCHLLSPADLLNEIGTYYPTRKEIALPTTTDDRKWCARTWDGFVGCFRWCGWSCRETFSWLY